MSSKESDYNTLENSSWPRHIDKKKTNSEQLAFAREDHESYFEVSAPTTRNRNAPHPPGLEHQTTKPKALLHVKSRPNSQKQVSNISDFEPHAADSVGVRMVATWSLQRLCPRN